MKQHFCPEGITSNFGEGKREKCKKVKNEATI
jgi:hypothetical protein